MGITLKSIVLPMKNLTSNTCRRLVPPQTEGDRPSQQTHPLALASSRQASVRASSRHRRWSALLPSSNGSVSGGSARWKSRSNITSNSHRRTPALARSTRLPNPESRVRNSRHSAPSTAAGADPSRCPAWSSSQATQRPNSYGWRAWFSTNSRSPGLPPPTPGSSFNDRSLTETVDGSLFSGVVFSPIGHISSQQRPEQLPVVGDPQVQQLVGYNEVLKSGILVGQVIRQSDVP